jgi:uncharacterized tellurite resistance protein B-like protein
MRAYPTNSPEAVTRLLSLAALADGHLDPHELSALERAGTEPGGLQGPAMRQVLHGVCQDMLSADHLSWDDACRLDSRTLGSLFDEIADPALRLQLLQRGLKVARADQHLHEAESQLLLDAMSHWGLLDETRPAPVPTPPLAAWELRA